jgi:P4 family phage/plasmid primase-like protien
MIVTIDGAAFEFDADEHFDDEAVAEGLAARGLVLADGASDEARVEALVRDVVLKTPRHRWATCSLCKAPIDADEGCGVCGTATEQPKFTEEGNAVRFARQHGERARFCRELDAWLVFKGTHWAVDSIAVMALAKETVRSIYAEAEESEDPKATAQHAMRSGSARAITGMLKLAQSEPWIAISTEDLDRDIELLNCPNGTLDLRTGELRKHDPADLITKLTAGRFDPAASSALWERVVREAMCEKPALVDFLARVCGSFLSGDTGDEKLFLPIGPGGGSKSTLFGACQIALGDYALTADFESFVAQKNGGNARNDIARLRGARLVLAIEAEEGKHLASALLKTLTGGDRIAARHLYKEHVEFKPQAKFVLIANDQPRVSDLDSGMWRRIAKLPFDHEVPKAKRDKRFKAELHDVTRSGAAILAWMMRGCIEWRRVGLAIPEDIEAATDAYRDSQDPLRDFFAEECIFEPTAWASRDAILKRYEQWMKQAGTRFALTPKTMAERLRKRGLTEKKNSGVRGWIGIGLAEQPVNDDGTIKGGPADWPSANASADEKRAHRARRAAFRAAKDQAGDAADDGALGAAAGSTEGSTNALFSRDGALGAPLRGNFSKTSLMGEFGEVAAPSALTGKNNGIVVPQHVPAAVPRAPAPRMRRRSEAKAGAS